MSIQLLDDESGAVLATAPCHRCANRLLGNVSFPQATVKYRAAGNDVDGRPFITSLSKSATFVRKDEIKFQVILEGENEVEYGRTISLNVTVHNLYDPNDSHYTFAAEPVPGFRQAFHPTSLVVPPGGNGSVNMIIVRWEGDPGSTHTFTAIVSDGCVIHSASKNVSILLPVRSFV